VVRMRRHGTMHDRDDLQGGSGEGPCAGQRARALRLMLSALAGGGVTAAALSGPLAEAVFGATRAKPSGGSGTVPLTVNEAPGGEERGTTGQASPSQTATTTTPATTKPATAPHEARQRPLVVTPEVTPSKSGAPAVAVQRRQQASKAPPQPKSTTPTAAKRGHAKAANPAAPGKGNVALAPQLVAAQAGVLAAELAGSAASVQALAFYRIPLFLLPIYQAAAAQYGVPWQILAAINEIETDYGNDLSVSSAGAVGWMQFMPATWIQYGVDALDAGYADPYNPVDAIFAAARYLRAAGASSNLRAAILAYNHSAEYVSSVLLRAKLISSYPNSVITALTGLTDGRLPVRNGQYAWDSIARLISPYSTTAQATAVNGSGALGAGAAVGSPAAPTAAASASAPAGTRAPTPASADAAADGSTEPPLQLIDLATRPNATVVAVQDGRIVKVASSPALGKYVVLRDVYGDVFTYAGLGTVAPHYRPAKPRPLSPLAGAALPGTAGATLPGSAGATLPGSAGAAAQEAAAAGGPRAPLTLHVAAPAGKQAHLARQPAATAQSSGPSGASQTFAAGQATGPFGASLGNAIEALSTPAFGEVRLFAHPGNPDALAARVHSRAHTHAGSGWLALRPGAIITKGTVLGHVRTPVGARDGHLRFAIRPAGDLGTVDPRPILENWSQLAAALHPQGARGEAELVGATASGVFLLSKADLQRDVLSDPGIALPLCARAQISHGAVDRRVLAALAFLSRSGLKPTVSALRCSASGPPAAGGSGDQLNISAIDGTPIAGNQGPGTITDVAIRTLLSLRGEFRPLQIVSLMQYPGSPSTVASPHESDHLRLAYRAIPPAAQASPAAAAAVANSVRRGAHVPTPPLGGEDLTSTEWGRLFTQLSGLHAPTVPVTRSSVAIPDRPQR
jgi:soluble lytic murein transglycosylase-like protein